jgi:Flp pilus assembly pilin Flp
LHCPVDHRIPQPTLPLISAVDGVLVSLRKWCRRFAFSESGQGLIEYSVIISVLSIGLVAVLLVLRSSTGNVYNDAWNTVDQAIACSNGSSTACTSAGADGGSTGPGTGGGSGEADNGKGNGNGGGNGTGNNGNGNGNGGGNGSNGQEGGKGNNP